MDKTNFRVEEFALVRVVASDFASLIKQHNIEAVVEKTAEKNQLVS